MKFMLIPALWLFVAGCCEPVVKYQPRSVYLQVSDKAAKIDALEKELIQMEAEKKYEVMEIADKYLIVKEYFDKFRLIVDFKNRYIFELETLIKENNKQAEVENGRK